MSDLFKHIASHYDDYRVSHRNFCDYISLRSDINEKSILVDVGCGTGNETLAIFNRFGCKIIGIDPSNEMLDKARVKTSLISWLNAPAEKIPLADHFCNFITAFFSVHYFTNFEKVIREFYRLLKPSGKIFIFTLTHEQLMTIKEYEFFPTLLQIDCNKFQDLNFLESSFKTNGFNTRLESVFYQDIPIDNNYIEMVKSRYRVSFNKISDIEIFSGIELIKNELDRKGPWIERVYCTLITAEKKS